MVITYNHARFIARALDSILCQKTDFAFAIHVIDDCSTDGAQDIIRDYAARYPGVVKPFINRRNIGRKVTQKNFYRGFRTLDGDYMAILEGDDCWTSPDRLQAHVSFLEANPDYVACAHNVQKVYDDPAKPPELYLPGPVKETHGIEDLISMRSFFHASSLTFRNVFRGRVPRYFRSPKSCDIFINIAHAQFGKIHYTPDVWSLYQVHAGGLFSGMSKTQGWIWNIEGFLAFNRWLGYRHVLPFVQTIYRYCDTLLISGRSEDGLTPAKRRRYARIFRRYRRLEKLWFRLDLALCRWIPGRTSQGLRKLNLGCGRRRMGDCVNVDIRPEADPDLLVDLERTPWPWPDDHAEHVFLLKALEHMATDGPALEAIVSELYRVCGDGALIDIVASPPKPFAFVDAIARFDRLGEAAGPARIDLEVVRRSASLAEPWRSQVQAGQLSSAAAADLMRTDPAACSEVTLRLRVHKPPRPGAGPSVTVTVAPQLADA